MKVYKGPLWWWYISTYSIHYYWKTHTAIFCACMSVIPYLPVNGYQKIKLLMFFTKKNE